MKLRRLVILMILTVSALAASAQTDELNRLLDIVLSLRSGGEKAYNAAVESLASDKLWTQMDELGRKGDAECKFSDRVPGFQLNSVLTSAENEQRKQISTGNHLNGADTRFDYSLYEKTLQSGKSVSYSLQNRSGNQTFLFVPYDKRDSLLKITVSCDGREFTGATLANGVVKFTGTASADKPVEVKVQNTGKKNVSYVIINYNSRK